MWPWSKLDFKKGASKLSRQAIHSRYRKDYPGEAHDIFELGDWPLYALSRSDSDEMWDGLPPLDFEYEAGFMDCENQTRRRMVQTIDYLRMWTNLRQPPAICEVRGYVSLDTNTGVEGKVGHSMLYEMLADGGSRLIEPANLIKKDLNHIEGLWLVYE